MHRSRIASLAALTFALATAVVAPAQAADSLRQSTRAGWVTLGIGPLVNLSNEDNLETPFTAVHLNESIGMHFDGRGEGAALALDLHQGFASARYFFGGFYVAGWNSVLFEAGPRFHYDIAIARQYGLYLSPSAGFHFALLHAYGMVGGFTGQGTDYGFAPQAALDVRLVLSDRVLVYLRPVGIDIPVIFDDRGNSRVYVNYDLQAGAGLTF